MIGGSWIRRMFCGSVCCCFCRSLSRLSSEYCDSCCSSDMLSITIGCRTLQISQICKFLCFISVQLTCYTNQHVLLLVVLFCFKLRYKIKVIKSNDYQSQINAGFIQHLLLKTLKGWKSISEKTHFTL